MSRRCQNCASWGSSDSVWGVCLREHDEDARMHVMEPRTGPAEDLETKFNFGCVEWRSAKVEGR
jgi:hypothetical protein